MTQTLPNPWTLVSSNTAYQNQWIRVREDQVLRPDGQPGIYGVVEIPPSVAVLALDEHERLLLVGQWRYTREKYSWEIPVGGYHARDSDIQATAVRELREEAGLQAANWKFLGTIEASIGVTTDTQWMFLATGLTQGPSQPDAEEQFQVMWIPFSEAIRKVLAGEIVEAATVATVLKFDALRRHGLL
jgi:8-oxo-dGTP pyrophosphatase MutT (NUDIX family)